MHFAKKHIAADTAQAETEAAAAAAESEGSGGIWQFPGLLSCGIGGGVLALLIGGGIELVNWLRRRREGS